jgi:hypothetical protein
MNPQVINKDINNRIKKSNKIYYEINNTVLGKKEVDPKNSNLQNCAYSNLNLWSRELAINHQA